jgi:late competence protein required for DNA uptake (superfamily II DNA/RNA helicase)
MHVIITCTHCYCTSCVLVVTEVVRPLLYQFSIFNRLYNHELDWAGSMFRWFDLCKCYNEVVDGMDRDGLGLKLLAIRSDSGYSGARLFPS